VGQWVRVYPLAPRAPQASTVAPQVPCQSARVAPVNQSESRSLMVPVPSLVISSKTLWPWAVSRFSASLGSWSIRPLLAFWTVHQRRYHGSRIRHHCQHRSYPILADPRQDGQLTTPEMSFWFTRLLNDLSAQRKTFGGVFTLGGQNSDLCITGDVEFLPSSPTSGRETYWLLNVSGTNPFSCLLEFFSRACLDYRNHCQWKDRQLAVWKPRCYRHWYDAHRWPFRRRFGRLRPDSRLPAISR
jgi:hypothetical protein